MITAILGFIFIYILYKLTSRPNNFPPGPRGLPYFGFAPFITRLDKVTHYALLKISNRYGPVSGIYLGQTPMIIVNDYETAKELFTRDVFTGRHINGSQWDVETKRLGVLRSDGELWHEQRRFTLRSLRDFGFGRQSHEAITQEELTDLIQYIKKSENNQVEIIGLFSASVMNVLWAIVTGKRYSHSDPQLEELLKMVQDLFKSGKITGGLASHFPILRKFGRKWSGFEDAAKRAVVVKNFIKVVIDEHVATYDELHMRDFIDVYLQELKKETKHESFSDAQLLAVTLDLFNAGSETTSTFLLFSMLYMLRHPDVQKKVQKELDEVVGRNRLPSLEDRPKLPYIEATMNEILRDASVIPVNVPRRAIQDTELGGYTIPYRASILVNLWNIHHDKDYWKDPENFRPERFLTEKGKFKKDERLMPFGGGKRVCLGESLARQTGYLFFTGLLHTFDITNPAGQVLPDPQKDVISGLTVTVPQFKAKMIPRD